MSYEVIERDGIRYAEVIWVDTRVEKTRFFSDAGSSFQFGLLAHETGFVEAAHYHHPVVREIPDLQQMFVVQRGVVAVAFFTEEGEQFREVVLRTGDAINLIHGAHSVRVIEDMQCVSIKQGPFLGDEMDKINIDAK
jgi:oxalate decarboxylase/phosphoglucose isomerase-like protein (cupin superfamily)